ncbi:MAG: hypothetical protein ACLS9K_10835 [Lachnospira eligens]
MFNKSYIKKAAAIAAVILAATALPVNMANADTQTTGSTVTEVLNELQQIRQHQNTQKSAQHQNLWRQQRQPVIIS